MTVTDAAWIVLVLAVVIALDWSLETAASLVSDRRSATRAALEREHEAHVIDDEAFARGLSSTDRAA
ncbi:MAG: hypothetical protein KGJ98_15030 [Chloroflexota bacterium]|nr:hypothetical protein [Chloroflexota bacterium]